MPLMPIPQANLNQEFDDFVQRYHNTYVKLSIPSLWENPQIGYITDVQYILSVEGTPKSFMIGIVTDPYLPSISIPKEQFEIVEALPSSKYVNDTRKKPTFSIFFSRIPERQFKRGCCVNTYMSSSTLAKELYELNSIMRRFEYVVELNNKFKEFKNRVDNGFNYENLKHLFDPIYPTFSDAYFSVAEGRALSCAFSKYYAVSTSFRHKDIVLLRKQVEIGIIKSPQSSFLLTPIEHIFHQEISDLIRRNIITNTILV